jgi:hypothetical protein
MAGTKHQFILGLVVKLMREQGISIVGVDGKYPGLFGEKITIPPQILRHRPDIIGIRDTGQICIGEAKTENDITSSRTYSQIQDFTSIELNGQTCDVFIGIPKISEAKFKKSMIKLGLFECTNITVLYIPDEIING